MIMKEDVISSTITKTEASESPSSNSPQQRPKPASRFKGLVPQSNGHWGAQIYVNQERIWLGTFKTEDIAACANDSAAMKLRRADCHRNFPLNDTTTHEPSFQALYSNDQVLEMIHDGSYQTKFFEFLSSIGQVNGSHPNSLYNKQIKTDGNVYKELFRKELTPSDVGKLNRLVIPKRYAVKYFNPHDLVAPNFGATRGSGDIELAFLDTSMRTWRFRYCFWESSSSFVFTRGWNRFVKAKNLKEKDNIAFYMCGLRENVDGNDTVRKFYMIDFVKYDSEKVEEDCNPASKRGLEEGFATENEKHKQKARVREEMVSKKERGFRLFGVQILADQIR